MAKRFTNWKDPIISARLAELWSAGHSCSTIARMLGNDLTRNAVIGAATRAKLPPRGYRPGGTVAKRIGSTSKSIPQAMGGKIARKKAGKPFVFGNKPASPLRAALIADGFPIPPPAETDVTKVSFADLEDKHCRWICKSDPVGHPQNEPLYCGADKVAGTSWCLNHLRRAFQPPQPRRPPAVSAPVPVPEKEREAA